MLIIARYMTFHSRWGPTWFPCSGRCCLLPCYLYSLGVRLALSTSWSVGASPHGDIRGHEIALAMSLVLPRRCSELLDIRLSPALGRPWSAVAAADARLRLHYSPLPCFWFARCFALATLLSFRMWFVRITTFRMLLVTIWKPWMAVAAMDFFHLLLLRTLMSLASSGYVTLAMTTPLL